MIFKVIRLQRSGIDTIKYQVDLISDHFIWTHGIFSRKLLLVSKLIGYVSTKSILGL